MLRGENKGGEDNVEEVDDEVDDPQSQAARFQLVRKIFNKYPILGSILKVGQTA